MKSNKNLFSMLSKKSSGVETPVTKSGVISTDKELILQDDAALRAGVDWIQCTFDTKYIDFVRKIAATFLGGHSFVERPRGLGCYEISYEHPSGAFIASHLKRPTGNVDYHRSYLEIKGKHLAPLTATRIRKFLRVLYFKVHAKFTHFDINIDDHKRRFDIHEIKKAYDESKVKGFRKTGDFREFGKYGETGLQFSLGKRGNKGSGQRLVFYDKAIESGGLINSIRVEANLYREHAQQAVRDIALSPASCMGQIIHGYIVGMVDFRDRRGPEDKNIQRRERLEFWKWFADDVPPIVVQLPYKVVDVDKVIKWFERIAPAFFTIMTVIIMRDGLEGFWVWFYRMVFDGEVRASERHKYLISSA